MNKLLIVLFVAVVVAIGVEVFLLTYSKPQNKESSTAQVTSAHAPPSTFIGIGNIRKPLDYVDPTSLQGVTTVRFIAKLQRVYQDNGNIYADLLLTNKESQTQIQPILVYDKNDDIDFYLYKQQTYDYNPQSATVTEAHLKAQSLLQGLQPFVEQEIIPKIVIINTPQQRSDSASQKREVAFEKYSACNKQLQDELTSGNLTKLSCMPFADYLNVFQP